MTLALGGNGTLHLTRVSDAPSPSLMVQALEEIQKRFGAKELPTAAKAIIERVAVGKEEPVAQ